MPEDRAKYLTFDHPIIKTKLPYVIRTDSDGELVYNMPIFNITDPMHLLWRFRNMFLSAKCKMFGGRPMYTMTLRALALKLQWGSKDMDASNKQAMAATFRLFDFKMDPKTKLLSETTVVREALCNAADYPTWLYINCAHRFFRIFWQKGRTPLENVQDAAYVIMLLVFLEA